MLVQINGREGPGRPERGVGKFRARFSHAFCVAEWLIFEFKAVSRAFVSSWNEEEEIDAASWRTREYESVLRNYVALEFDRSMGKFNLSAGITVVCFLLGIAFGLNSKNSHFSPSTQAQESLDERSSPMVVLYVSEQCDHDFELDLMDIVVSMGLDRVMNDTKFYTVPKSVMCATNSSRTSTFLEMVKDPKSRFIVGSIEPSLCSVGQSLAQLHNITLVTWSCSEIHGDSLNLVNILPSKRTILNAIVNIVSTIRWRSISIITNSDENWWSDLAFRLGLALKKLNRTIIKNFILLNKQDTQESIERQLSKLKQTITSGVILCLPVYEEFTQRIIKMIDTRNFLEHPQSSLMMIDMFTGLPILSFNYSISSSLKLQRNGTDKNYHSYNQFAPSSPESSESNLSSQSERRSELHRNHSSQLPNSFFKNQSNAQKIAHPNEKLSMLHLGNSSRVKIEVAAAGPEDKQSLTSVKLNGNQTELNSNNSYFPLHRHSGYRVSKKMGDNLLVFTLSDYFFHRSSKNEMEYLFKSSLEVVKNSTKFIENQKFHFLLADVLNFSTNNPISRIAWRPVLDISCNFKNCTERNNSQFKTEFLIPNASSWIRQKSSWVYDGSVGDMCDDFTSCPDDDDELMFDEQYGTLVMGVLLTSAIFIGLLFVCCFVRRQYLKSKTAKGPVKILLTPADFVFPQVQDTGGLQEFGGPSMKEKPDLLKGSVLSLKSQQTQQQRKNSTSSLSLSRPFVIDSRARYNGDLVQLKELPMQGGNFELKSKAMDILVSLHGLRHENLNPLIGCLTDPARPALVWEWCSRGSLEDVLIQDEIKLDWTFRLSLLTDLVRGMRYLHTCPYRVHGALTSRNCVIDARWVLKITDYSLTTFYEAQNITSPEKSARDLLWTAPELLRSPMNAKRGTQSGDVYSFAIIMQEVVVRGEPFCMLSLTPEDIIEKVKRPPPLIRPSVSKGAAPPEAINIMRQCWAEQPDKRPDFNGIFDLFKTLNHGRKANFVDTMFQMLEKYSNNLEDLIRDRTEQLDMEKKKTEQLLNRMLPSTVAEKLKLGMPVDPEDFEEVTIYFSDIVGFTTISAYSTPFEVVDLLNDLYTCFDATINAYNVYKVETIGDAYMVVGGLPVRIPDHADQIATMALHLLHQSGKFKIRHLPFTPLRLRIGLHTGPCCAGVVGLTMPRYCLFGDTVNTASRLESTGAAWRIHLSQATKEKLDQVGEYEIQYRGETELKGKGKMPTYWLLGKTGFNKELPVPPLLEESHGLDENLIRYGRTGLYETGVSSIEGLRPQIGPRESEESGSVDLSIEFSASQTSPPTTTTSQTTRQSLEAIAAQKILKNQFSLDARLGVGVPLHGGSIRAGTKLEKHRTFDAHLITVTNRDDDEEVSDSTTHAENDLGNVSGVSLNVTNLLRVHSSGLSTPFSISDTEFDLQYIDQASSSASSNTSRNQLEPPTVATISKPHQATENDRSCPQKSPLLRPNLKQNIENPFISITNREYPVISAEEKSKLIEMSRVPEPKDRDSLKTVQDTSLSNNINSFATCINNSNNSNSHSISNNNNINNSSNTFNNNSSRAGLDNVIVQNVHAEPASTCIPGSNNSINNNDCSKIGESSNYKTDNAISSIFRVVNPQKHKQDYDISTPYSHYRCLSPMSETSTEAASHRLSVGMGRLKRQFSVDKTDEIGVVEGLCLSTTGLKTSTGGNQQSSSGNRLFKQNSAGAASDLERIAEEAAAAGASGLPATGNKFTSKDDYYKHRLNVPSLKSISASSESLH